MKSGRKPSRNSVFWPTILSVLRSGPMKAEELHPVIKARHPEWCDDSNTIELGYQSREPKWQRSVRSALQFLKGKELVEKEPGRNRYWRLK